MGWIIFLLITCLLSFVFVPIKQWKHLWPAGIITMILIYLIDSTFIRLEAFSYINTYFVLEGIPIFYLLSGFFGGIILAYFYTPKKQWQLPYTSITAAIFVLMELVMYRFGYFYYNKWNIINSYFLDVIGFSLMFGIAQVFNAIGKSSR